MLPFCPTQTPKSALTAEVWRPRNRSIVLRGFSTVEWFPLSHAVKIIAVPHATIKLARKTPTLSSSDHTPKGLSLVRIVTRRPTQTIQGTCAITLRKHVPIQSAPIPNPKPTQAAPSHVPKLLCGQAPPNPDQTVPDCCSEASMYNVANEKE